MSHEEKPLVVKETKEAPSTGAPAATRELKKKEATLLSDMTFEQMFDIYLQEQALEIAIYKNFKDNIDGRVYLARDTNLRKKLEKLKAKNHEDQDYAKLRVKFEHEKEMIFPSYPSYDSDTRGWSQDKRDDKIKNLTAVNSKRLDSFKRLPENEQAKWIKRELLFYANGENNHWKQRETINSILKQHNTLEKDAIYIAIARERKDQTPGTEIISIEGMDSLRDVVDKLKKWSAVMQEIQKTQTLYESNPEGCLQKISDKPERDFLTVAWQLEEYDEAKKNLANKDLPEHEAERYSRQIERATKEKEEFVANTKTLLSILNQLL